METKNKCTIYQPKDLAHEAKLALRDMRKHNPDVKVTLNNPPWFLVINNETREVCLAIRLSYEGNGIRTESHYNVAI